MAVISPNSDAKIRNAVVSSLTFERAVQGTLNNLVTLVDRALDCSDPDVCGPGHCVDTLLGVLCGCLEGGECVDDGGELSLGLKQKPDAETFRPDPVTFELVVSSGSDGTTHTIWDLGFAADGLYLDVFPSNGVLPPGGSVNVLVTGTPSRQDVGGSLTSNFKVWSMGSTGSFSTAVETIEVNATFYLCPAHECAMPLPDDDNDDDDGVFCQRCATIDGEVGVNCELPGATKHLLPVQQGYWRSSNESLVVCECLHSDACAGATEVSSSDDYCADGYRGPHCAVCTEGYGRSLSNTCHSCHGTNARLLIGAATLSSLVMILLILVAVVFLIGGLDAVNVVRQSVIQKVSSVCNAFRKRRVVKETYLEQRNDSNHGASTNAWDRTIAPVNEISLEMTHVGGERGNGHGRGLPSNSPERDEPARTCSRPLGVVVPVVRGIGQSSVTRTHAPRDEPLPTNGRTRRHPPAGAVVPEEEMNRKLEEESGGGGMSETSGLGQTIMRSSQRLPMDKLKILLGVWQILAVFTSITGVEFPASYALFLSWINILNFDLGYILPAACVLPSVNFYQQLLATTITPFVVAVGLVLTYRMAMDRAGIGSVGIIAKRAAWSRHVTAGLLLTFLVFTSASSAVLKTFACDDVVVEGRTYLRADYSISCDTKLHMFFKVYAGFMILVYPIGIPILYFCVLWRKRELLNPRIYSGDKPEGNGARDDDTGAGFFGRKDNPSAILLTASNGQTKDYWSPRQLQELDERIKARTEHPELVPFIFLWRDFGSNIYYYEVVECGRRILLTEVLIFIAPHSALQAAMACIFAFISLLAFELIRPHVDPADSWLYRLGCVVIFLSYFLALLIKIKVVDDAYIAALGGLLVAINMLLVVAVLWISGFAIRQIARDSDDEDDMYV